MIDTLVDLFASAIGAAPESVEPIAGAGSNRRYFRLSGADTTLIGVEGTDRRENEAFVYLSRHFRQAELPVPEVLAVSADGMSYLQQDLGSTSLFDLIREGDGDVRRLLSATMRRLPDIQFGGGRRLDYIHCYPQPEFDERTVMWDLNYFKYCFLKPSGITFDESALEDDFRRLSTDLTDGDVVAFMYRDFQSRNVMVHNDQPWFIDFQGGRKGPYLYDVASFLWQARAGFSDTLRSELVGEYMDSLSRYITVDESQLRQRLKLFVLFRTLQVLGAYGFRGYFERKRHFIDSIPPAIANLRPLIAMFVDRYGSLCDALRQLTEVPAYSQPDKPGLTVRVYSFSYKKGIPEDPSGNGGGFVFDCRAIHNPGRYDRYKQLSGLDRPVIEFLERDGEILAFLDHCYALVDASAQRYISRGFTDLSVSFGCTGGQHRSVYSAQHMAEHISEKFGVRVELEHREQNIKRIFEPR